MPESDFNDTPEWELYQRRSFWVSVDQQSDRPTMHVYIKQRPNFPCMGQVMRSIDGDMILDNMPSRGTFQPCDGRRPLAPVEHKVYMHPNFNNMATYISQEDFEQAMARRNR